MGGRNTSVKYRVGIKTISLLATGVCRKIEGFVSVQLFTPRYFQSALLEISFCLSGLSSPTGIESVSTIRLQSHKRGSSLASL